MIGEACKIVEPRDISVVPLMDAKEPEEVRWRGVGCGATLTLPEGGVEVIAFAYNGALTGVEGLGESFEVNEPAGELEVRVGDGARGVVRRDEETSDVVWPFKSPQDGDVGLPTFPRSESIAWEPRATGAFT